MSEETEKKGRDDGYMQADGSLRPIREVIAAQKKNHNAQEKHLRESAFRERAKMQALLATCLCCYPLVKYETASGHDEWCPSEGMHQSFEVVRKEREGRATLTVTKKPSTPVTVTKEQLEEAEANPLNLTSHMGEP